MALAVRPAFSAKNARDIRKQRERERETRRTKAMNSARRRPGTDREREDKERAAAAANSRRVYPQRLSHFLAKVSFVERRKIREN